MSLISAIGRAFLAFSWRPPGEDNAVLRRAVRRFFGEGKFTTIRTAARYQAILQIVRFLRLFECALPRLPVPEALRRLWAS